MTLASPIPSPPAGLPAVAHDKLCALYDWLYGDGRKLLSRTRLFHAGFCNRLMELGIPIERSSLHVRQLHPQFSGRSLLWNADAGGTVEIDREYGVQQSEMFLKSPVKPIYEDSGPIRRRLLEAATPVDFPILADLKEQAFTDYVIYPLRYAAARPTAISFATRHPQGFQADELTILEHALPGFAAATELIETRRTARLLLETYLGPKTGAQVLSGEIRRGQGRVIDAVLWYSDLAQSTELSNRLPLREMIGLLNKYFGLMSEPIERHGGEVLKFIGDAVLAIFPLEENYRHCSRATKCALSAAREALQAVEDFNRERAANGGDGLIETGIALHIGQVMYGNVGATNRLDFTVVGPAVNLVSRLADLCRDQHLPLVLSDEFAKEVDEPMRSLGAFPLKGFEAPVAAYGLPVPKP